jgi:hypothetical protein
MAEDTSVRHISGKESTIRTKVCRSLSDSRAAARRQALLGPICAARADARGTPSRTDLHVPVHGQSTSVTAPRGAAGFRMPPRGALCLCSMAELVQCANFVQVAEGMGVTGAPPCVSRGRCDAFFLASYQGVSKRVSAGRKLPKLNKRIPDCIHVYMGMRIAYKYMGPSETSMGTRQKWRSGERAPTAVGPRYLHRRGLILVTVLLHG